MAMDNYSDVIKLRFSTDEAPDVIFGQPKSYTDLIDNGLIKDLSGKIDNGKQYIRIAIRDREDNEKLQRALAKRL